MTASETLLTSTSSSSQTSAATTLSTTTTPASDAKCASPETATATHCTTNNNNRTQQHNESNDNNDNANDDDAAALERVATTGSGKQCVTFASDRLRFSSRFDGGNMQSVTRTGANTFAIAVAEDAAASGTATGYTTWFYFEVEALPLSPALGPDHERTDAPAASGHAGARDELRVVLTNMNGQKGLYANGYTVMYSAMDASGTTETASADDVERWFEDERRWKRLPTPLAFEKYTQRVSTRACAGDGTESTSAAATEPAHASSASEPTHKQELKVKLAFSYRFQSAHERVRFAFCYPHSYTRLQRRLAALDAHFAAQSGADADAKRVYYHRELLTRSIEGLRVDLLTISSRDGLTATPEPPLDGVHAAPSGTKRALAFDRREKRTVLISARVHPAETPASFMLDGMLELLLHPTDATAAALRRHFVFKVVPMLNPDGVCQGYYRTDTRGVNLNRVYEAPSAELAPAVFAAKALLLQIVEAHGGVYSERAQRSVVYLDLHAHANRRGCFVYGNSVLGSDSHGGSTSSNAKTQQIETQLYARLVALHTPYFDYLACSFERANMSRHDARDNGTATTSRAGCSRVALFRATGLTFVYTIECNYNEGRRNLRHAPALASSASPAASVSSSPTTAPSGVVTPAPRTSQSTPELLRASSHPSSSALVRHAAPLSGTRLYMKFSPAEWRDVGIGSIAALLDLFQLPGRGKMVQESPFRSLDGIRKSLWAELKSAELGNAVRRPSSTSSSSSSSSNGRDARGRSKSVAVVSTLATTRRPSSKM